MIRKYRRLTRVAVRTVAETRRRGGLAGTPRTRMLALIDTYRAATVAHCLVCQTTPTRSVSYRVRDVTARRGATAGLALFTALALLDLVVCALFGPARFNSGGW